MPPIPPRIEIWGTKRPGAKRPVGAKRPGAKRPGAKRPGGETSRGGNGLGAKRPGTWKLWPGHDSGIHKHTHGYLTERHGSCSRHILS